jgi:hypothetical protein
MNDKETILSIIRNNGWVTGVRHYELISDLGQHYRMDRATAESIIHECLIEGLITVKNERYTIAHPGVRYLQDVARNEYVHAAYKAANAPASQSGQKDNTLEKWSWIAGIIGTIVAVIVAVYELLIKK